ncbi:MAG: putative bifunctional diguanylate cyclase/phosphodiesterase [Paracoccaceae bacterium]
MSNGQKAVQSIAVPVATGVWEFDEDAVLDDLSALEEWEGFVFAQVVDQAGMFATFPSEPAVPEDWDTKLSSFADGSMRGAFGTNFAFAAPLQHETHGEIGNVIVVFSRDAIDAKLTRIGADAAIFAIIAFSIFGVVLCFVALSVTVPVSRVTRQIERAAAGDLDIRPTDTLRTDEVGRLARAVEVFNDSAVELASVRAKAEAAETVARMALIDPLTELLNRRGLDDVFKTSMKTSSDALIGFINIDLDDFKQVNDMHGHGIGDAVLCEVSQRIKNCFPAAIAIARVGGDEFLVLHPVRSSGATVQLARDAIAAIRRPIHIDTLQCHVGACAGIDVQTHRHFKAEQGILNSDQALYRAKRNGKNCVHLYEISLGAEIRRQNDLAGQMRAALENDEFIPFFQPQVDSNSLQVVGAEVLARWQQSDGTILAPGAFLGVADELSLTSQIDACVAEKAIATFETLAKIGIDVPPLSVNVSGKRLQEPGLIKMLSRATKSGLSVNIELVEAIFLDDADEKTLLVLDQLRELKVGVEIDDFGTGHASIAGLIRVLPDTIKVDKQFIDNIVHAEQPRQLLKVFVDLAKTLDMVVLAEGVESMDQVSILRSMGVTRLQGYAFSKPLPADKLANFLRNEAA